MEEEKKSDEKKLKAKRLSLIAMAFSTLWITALTILKSVGLVNLSVEDIVESAAAIVAMWCPTYVSMWLDKIKQIRFGDGEDVKEC